MLYTTIIALTCLIVSALNYFLNPMGLHFYEYVLLFIIGIALIIAIEALNALILKLLPKKWFDNYCNKPFYPSKKEIKFYKKIRVQKWKELVPEWGAAGGFRKNKIYKPSDTEYLRRFIYELANGIIMHYCSFFTTYLMLPAIMPINNALFPIDNNNLLLTLALPCAIVGSILWLLPAFVLKYNLPKVIRLYEAKSKGLI